MFSDYRYISVSICIILYTTLSIVREQLNYNAVQMNMNSQQSDLSVTSHPGNYYLAYT